jgi:hypothetical protein
MEFRRRRLAGWGCFRKFRYVTPRGDPSRQIISAWARSDHWWPLGLATKTREQRAPGNIFGGMGADRQPSFDHSIASRPAHPLCSTPVRDVERLYGEIHHLSSADTMPWVIAHRTI